MLRVTVWGHRAQCDCVGHRNPTVNEQAGDWHQQMALRERVFGPLCVAEYSTPHYRHDGAIRSATNSGAGLVLSALFR